jgi:hypothetical protein
MPRPRVVGLGCIAAGFLASVVGPPSARAQRESPDQVADEVPLRLLYRPYVNTFVTALYRDGVFYLPLGAVLAQLEINHRLEPAEGVVSGFYLDKNTPYRIGFRDGSARVARRTVPLPTESFVATELEFFVLPVLFEELFGLRVEVHEGALAIQVTASRELPVAESVRRRERNQRLLSQTDTIAPDVVFPRDRRVLDGGVLQYSASASQSERGTEAALDLRAGVELLGGDLELGVQGMRIGAGVSQERVSARWRYVFGGEAAVSQVTFGRVFSTGLRSLTLDGVEITNRPVTQRLTLGTHVIQGDALPDWEVELLVNDGLVGYSRADQLGRYRFELPLGFGTSVVRLRFHGPAGELREEAQAIQVPFTFVPPGRFDYAVSAGQLEGSGDRTVRAQAAIGITGWLTTQTGVDYIADSDSARPVVYQTISARPVAGLNLALDAAPSALYRATSEVFLPSRFQFTTSFARYRDDSPLNPQRAAWELTGQGYGPLSSGAVALSTRVTGAVRRFISGARQLTGDIEAMLNVGPWMPSLGYRRSSVTDVGAPATIASEIRASSSIFLGAWRGAPAFLRNGFLRAVYTHDLARAKPVNLQVFASRPLLQDRRLEFGFTRDFVTGSNQLEARFLWDISSVRSASSVHRQPGGTTVTQSLSGAIGYDSRRAHLAMSEQPWVGRAGASIQLFLDENGNDVRDRGEPLLPGGTVRLDRASPLKLTRPGVLRASELVAYQRYTAVIDPASLKNPLWIPKFASFSFIADPNRYKSIDVPFVVGGTIDGTVLLQVGDEDRPVPGLRMLLRRDGDSTITRLPTFADGSYYHPGLPPGKYEVSVDHVQLDLLRVVSEPVSRHFELKATKEGDYIERLDFVLVPRSEDAHKP